MPPYPSQDSVSPQPAARTRNLINFPASSSSSKSHLSSVPKSWWSCLSRGLLHTGCPGPQAPVSMRTTKSALTAGPLRAPPPPKAVYAVFTTPPVYTTTRVVFKLTKPCSCLKPFISPGTKTRVPRTALEPCSL